MLLFTTVNKRSRVIEVVDQLSAPVNALSAGAVEYSDCTSVEG